MNALRRTLFTLAVAILSAPFLFAQSASLDPSSSPASASIPPAADAPALDLGNVFEQPKGAPPTPRHTGVRAMVKGLGTDFRHLPSRTNLLVAGVGGALALAVHPLDDDVSRKAVGNSTADNIFNPGRVIGAFPTLLGVSATVYAVGRTRDEPKVSHLGMDLLRSLTVSEVLTQTLKYTTRRERPDSSGKNSFPSGHAADTFAVATALERHLSWRYAVPGYLFASYVAASRLPANRHWLSDVTFGAAVGIIAGRTVTRHGREIPITPVSVPGGMGLMYQRTW